MFKFQDLNMQKIDFRVAKQYISENHYSHTLGSSIRLSLGFFYKNELVTAIIYGYPVGRRTSKYLSSNRIKNAELVRLFSKDGLPKNTESYCIGQSFTYIRHHIPELKYLISYADSNHGHVGYIYQATNWLYIGKSQPGNATFVIDGKNIHPRTLYSWHGTSDRKIIKEIYKDRVIIKKTLPKYIYLMCLGNKKDRKNWYRKFESKPYPKLGGKNV